MSYKTYNNNEVVQGYKSFILKDNKLYDGYDNVYEVGKSYHQYGKIGFGRNGYHFCLDPADTLAYSTKEDNLVVCEVIGYGNMYSIDDEYKDIDDIHIAENFKINRIIPEIELLEIIKNYGYITIEKYIKYQYNSLTKEKLEYLIENQISHDKERFRNLYEIVSSLKNKGLRR